MRHLDSSQVDTSEDGKACEICCNVCLSVEFKLILCLASAVGKKLQIDPVYELSHACYLIGWPHVYRHVFSL